MNSYFFLPPLPNISGGMAVIVGIADELHKCGFHTVLVCQTLNDEQRAFVEARAPHVPLIGLKELRLTPHDRWIIPEGWPVVLDCGLRAGAQTMVYVQNWAYLLGHRGICWQHLPVRLCAVSRPVAQFIQITTGMDAPIIHPAIDPALFFPKNGMPASQHTSGAPVISWMPRKNRHLAKQIQTIFEAICTVNGYPAPFWQEIHNLPLNKVAEALRASDIFLATGFPEGCPLPPLEAMACGCIVAGFSGFGGQDYMHQALENGCCFEFDANRSGPNGFFAPDGDVIAAALALAEAYKTVLEKGRRYREIREQGFLTAAFYSQENQREELLAIWNNAQFWETGEAQV